jgi:hypothetical protein
MWAVTGIRFRFKLPFSVTDPFWIASDSKYIDLRRSVALWNRDEPWQSPSTVTNVIDHLQFMVELERALVSWYQMGTLHPYN